MTTETGALREVGDNLRGDCCAELGSFDMCGREQSSRILRGVGPSVGRLSPFLVHFSFIQADKYPSWETHRVVRRSENLGSHHALQAHPIQFVLSHQSDSSSRNEGNGRSAGCVGEVRHWIGRRSKRRHLGV